MRLIDGDAIYAEIDKFRDLKDMNGFELIQLDCTLAVIKNAKTIDPVKHGRWEYVGEQHGAHVFECSECHGRIDTVNPNWLSKYCSGCGAKMDAQ